MKRFIVGFILMVGVFGCMPGDKMEKKSSDPSNLVIDDKKKNDHDENNNGNNHEPPPQVTKLVQGQSDIVARNYNQINATFSALTGIPKSDQTVIAEFEAVKNQLPAENDPSALGPFNHIAALRLASVYCDKFIDQNSNFKSINYASIANSELATKLLGHFLDSDPSEIEEYNQLYSSVLSILNNENKIAPSGDKKSLAKMACSAILSSYFIII